MPLALLDLSGRLLLFAGQPPHRDIQVQND